MKRLMNVLFAAVLAIGIFAMAKENVQEPPDAAFEAAVQLENVFGYVAEKARPAVVVITNVQYAGNQMEYQQFPFEEFFFPNPYMRPRQPRRPEGRRALRPANTGSGAIISADGYVVTNYHVVENCEYLRVKLADGTVYDNQKKAEDVKLIGVDKESDLAVLQLAGGKKKDFSFLKFADINSLKVGQWAIAIGAPHQLEQSVTIGNVSQVGRHNMGVTTFDNYIQTDASLNPGNSGGPLLNIRGEIIGINEFIHTDGMGQGNIGLGFAIACDLAENVSRSLIEDGEVKRPFLGIAMQDLTPELKKQFNVENGVLVTEAIKDKAAEKAGVKSGDIITAINGKPVKDSYELRTAVTNYKPGDEVKLSIVRDEKPMDIKVVTGKRELADVASKDKNGKDESSNDEFDKLGLELEVEEGEVVISGIDPNGAAAAASSSMANGLRIGDVILEVNRQQVSSVRDVKAALKRTRNNVVVLLIERSTRGRSPGRMYVTIPLE
ncbi:MAG: trypsin-like peptidase domain-containing protein [Victivallales bacterium]|nr:trypsin-like peptidase domain-containing protein [Victivallales bacterium]